MTDTRPRAEVLRQTAASMGCSGPVLDDVARAIIASTLRDGSAEPGEMTAAEWAQAERIAAQADAAMTEDRRRGAIARASGWKYWPEREPDAPRWPTKGATT